MSNIPEEFKSYLSQQFLDRNRHVQVLCIFSAITGIIIFENLPCYIVSNGFSKIGTIFFSNGPRPFGKKMVSVLQQYRKKNHEKRSQI